MVADLRLGGRCVNRLRQLVRFLQAFRQLNTADGSVLLVAGPAAACDIAADDALDGKHLKLSAHHGFAPELLLLEVLRHILCVNGNHVVRQNILCHIEPEFGHLSQHCALLCHFIMKNHIEAADTVCRYHNQAVAVVVNLTYLTFFDRFHFLHILAPHHSVFKWKFGSDFF